MPPSPQGGIHKGVCEKPLYSCFASTLIARGRCLMHQLSCTAFKARAPLSGDLDVVCNCVKSLAGLWAQQGLQVCKSKDLSSAGTAESWWLHSSRMRAGCGPLWQRHLPRAPVLSAGPHQHQGHCDATDQCPDMQMISSQHSSSALW